MNIFHKMYKVIKYFYAILVGISLLLQNTIQYCLVFLTLVVLSLIVWGNILHYLCPDSSLTILPLYYLGGPKPLSFLLFIVWYLGIAKPIHHIYLYNVQNYILFLFLPLDQYIKHRGSKHIDSLRLLPVLLYVCVWNDCNMIRL